MKTERRIIQTRLPGVRLHEIPLVKDPRGDLTVGEFQRDIPFQVKRYFIVLDVPSERIRGEHAHKVCEQFLICVRGQCSLVVDDGISREEIHLNRPTLGIHLSSLIWGIQHKHSHDAVLLVFASEYYDADDYVRDYETFLKLVKSPGNFLNRESPGNRSDPKAPSLLDS